jgi:transposase
LAEHHICVWHRQNQASRNRAGIPGIGPIIAGAMVASVVGPLVLRTGRELAALIGLAP